MTTDNRAALAAIKTFPQLVAYLRDEMNWPIQRSSFEDVDDLYYDYTADELGIDSRNAAKIRTIKRLRPLTANQPWGIFFVEFEPKTLPVVALRRILGQVVQKKRASAKGADRVAWSIGDLLFISNYGEAEHRQITFAHFSQPEEKEDLPTLKVLGWDNLDTASHLDRVSQELTEHLSWPEDDSDAEAWRAKWRSAFALRHREVITSSQQLSMALAGLARNIRDRINTALKIETERGPLTKLMSTFRESLLHDLKPDDFADMYAQTIAYGLLSARIADPDSKTADDFARHMRTNPFLRELMETFLHVGGRRGRNGNAAVDFDELGVNDVVELLDRANMAAVVADFGDRNPQDDPVIHFYELFLKDYDAKKRMQRGVFYTPKPVVSYIIAAVDQLLRTQFGLDDGLADTTTWGEMAARRNDLKIPEGTPADQQFVQILDPACGTGTFLVEVIDVIHRTMTAKWVKLGLGDAKRAELWNDYVAVFLLPRLHGYELLMAPYAIAHLKIGLKLHETGYHFGSDERARIFLTNALEPASDTQFRLSAMPALAHEAQVVNHIKSHHRVTVVIGNPPYNTVSKNMGSWIKSLVDVFRFVDGVRMKEKGYRNHMQDDYVKFYALADRLLHESGRGLVAYVTNNGFLDNATFRGMRNYLLNNYSLVSVVDLHGDANRKESEQDENVFDIQQGVAIGMYVRSSHSTAEVNRADLLGARASKYAKLKCNSLTSQPLRPSPPQYLFRERDDTRRQEWDSMISIDEVMPIGGAGVKTNRDDFAIDFDDSPLVKRMEMFRDPSISDAEVKRALHLSENYTWKVSDARRRFRLDANHNRIENIMYRPFDRRRIYYQKDIVYNPRFATMGQMLSSDNLVLAVTRANRRASDGYYWVSSEMVDVHILDNAKDSTYVFPLFVRTGEDRLATLTPNFNADWAVWREHKQDKGDAVSDARRVMAWIYALFHSRGYRETFSPFLHSEFPRIPRSCNGRLFLALAVKGEELIRLHTLQSLVTRSIGQFAGNVTTIEAVRYENGAVWLDSRQENAFHNVPEEVWSFRIGGYQVCEKWLKDRKGRTLSDDDIAHYQKILVAVSGTIRLMKEIDDIIEQHGGWPGAFQTLSTPVIAATTSPTRVRIVDDPPAEERYRSCVPLVPLKAAATNLDQDAQFVVDNEWPWMVVDSKHGLRPGMFAAQIAGRSMEPRISDGAYCLFASPVEGSRQGMTVLVKLHRGIDPESGANYTLKRYESEKVGERDSWRHVRILLKPENPEFPPLVFTESPEEEFAVVAELVEVLEARPEPQPPNVGARSDAGEPNPPARRTQQRLSIAAPQQKTASFPTHGLFAPRATKPAEEHHEASEDINHQRRLVDQYRVDDVLLQVRDVVSGSDPIDREDAIREIARRLGAARTGSRMRELIESALNTASRRAIIETVDGGLVARTRSIEEYHRDFLKTALKNVVGRTWTDEDEAIRAATRWLGFRRTGHKIEQAFKSAIRGALRQDLMERDRGRIRFVE